MRLRPARGLAWFACACGAAASILASPLRHNLVDGVLPHVFVRVHPEVVEHRQVVLGDAAHDLVERTRNEQLVGLGEVHDPLRDVDGITDDPPLALELHDLDGAQVDPQPDIVGGQGVVVVLESVAQADRHEQDLLRVAQVADRHAVTSVHGDALLALQICQPFLDERVEMLTHGHLALHRELGVAHDVQEQDIAKPGAVFLLLHGLTPRFPSRLSRRASSWPSQGSRACG